MIVVVLLSAVVVLPSAIVVAGSDALRISVAPPAVHPGELVVLTLSGRGNLDGASVRAFDRDVPVFSAGPGTWVALLGIDLAVAPGRYEVTVAAPGREREPLGARTLRVLPRTFPVRRLHVPDAFANPPPDARARIAREAADLDRIWRSASPRRLWTGPFVRPVDGAVSGQFGARSVFNGEPRPAHTGADFSSPVGTPVKAPAAGTIVLARSLYLSGNTIVIDHGLGLFSLLAHLSAFEVQEGASVAAAQVVGLTGATGRVTGPHLHWSVRVGSARVDPLSVLAILGAPAF
jgi:hypothetical protein